LNVNGNNTDLDAYPDAVDNLLEAGTLDKGGSVTGNLAGEIKIGAPNPKLKMSVSYLDNSKNITFALK
ncbi:Extracellular protein, partial [Ligilactobacillus saerimneri 30a]